jgi:transcriptional antiterminator RfaH
MPWAVALSKPNQEAIAAVNLQRQGFEYYYPRFLHKKPGSSGTIRPLFPRYMFVLIGQTWRSLSGTRGISYLLMSEGGPQTVPDQIIAGIKGREDKSGLFQLAAPPKFMAGVKVKTNEGPFTGVPLIYEGMAAHERCSVLAEILGRQVKITIEEKLLVAA